MVFGIEPGKGFVHNNERRDDGKRARNGDTAAHSAGKLLYRAESGAFIQPERGKDRKYFGFAFAFAHRGNIAVSGEALEKSVLLEHRGFFCRGAGYRAAVRRECSQQDTRKRRLDRKSVV